MRSAGDRFGWLGEKETLDDYLSRLSADGQWGGTSELIALASLLRTTIFVFVRWPAGKDVAAGGDADDDAPSFVWEEYRPRDVALPAADALPPTDKAIYLSNLDEHYEPVLEIEVGFSLDCDVFQIARQGFATSSHFLETMDPLLRRLNLSLKISSAALFIQSSGIID